MKLLRSLFFLLSVVVLSMPLVADDVPLIPRDVLLGNPDRVAPQISPDGKFLAFVAPDDKNVLQVWVRPIASKEAKKLTNDPKRGIRQYSWCYDNKHLSYMQDTDGDENFHLYAVDVATGSTRELTPHKGVRVQGLHLDDKFPGTILIGMNRRSPQLFDMYSIDIATGQEKLVAENRGDILAWFADDNMKIRAAQAMKPDGTKQLLVRKAEDQPWDTILTLTDEEEGDIQGFSKDGKSIYLATNRNANAVRLTLMELETKKETVIAEDAEFDLAGGVPDRKTYKPLAVMFNKARAEWKVLDEAAIGADIKFLSTAQRGDFMIGSRSLDDKSWTVGYLRDDGPTSYYVYDRTNKKLDYLFSNFPKLEGLKLSQMKPIEFDARDGLKIRGYLSLPVGKEPKNLPLVLLVHGGPWARDSWGYNGMVQFLCNRGYAVLQINFRGSTGYGKKFLNAGNREWAGKMHDDLIDGINWINKQGMIDQKKIGIMGGSYGGYATLVGLTYTPDQFACGVDIVGPSNINTLLASIPPYWAPMKSMFNKRVGEDQQFLKDRSPLYKVDKIKVPLLIGQGKNDPRVKQAESDQIYDAMKKASLPVQYAIYSDEGHGFARPENRLHFFAITEEFLAKHLGGRYESMGEIKGHSATIK